jgi:hypothetical protein
LTFSPDFSPSPWVHTRQRERQGHPIVTVPRLAIFEVVSICQGVL